MSILAELLDWFDTNKRDFGNITPTGIAAHAGWAHNGKRTGQLKISSQPSVAVSVQLQLIFVTSRAKTATLD